MRARDDLSRPLAGKDSCMAKENTVTHSFLADPEHSTKRRKMNSQHLGAFRLISGVLPKTGPPVTHYIMSARHGHMYNADGSAMLFQEVVSLITMQLQ